MDPTLFDHDIHLLLDRYHTIGTNPPPWTWAALTPRERAALATLIDHFVTSYNQTYATTEDDLIPPCWPQHPGLAYELAVHVWLWYCTHHDPNTTPEHAGDYYLRHLPGLRHRLDHHLGRSPGECRTNHHPTTWRTDADTALQTHQDRSTTDAQHRRALATLASQHFGFTPEQTHADQPPERAGSA